MLVYNLKLQVFNGYIFAKRSSLQAILTFIVSKHAIIICVCTKIQDCFFERALIQIAPKRVFRRETNLIA